MTLPSYPDGDCVKRTARRHTTAVDPFNLRVPADPASLAVLRTELKSWLERAGVRSRHAFEAVAAASEATSNAIEHAQEPTQPFVDVTAARTDGLLRVTVRDYGHWQPPRLDSDRNHGLLLIDSLMTKIEIDRAPEGTTVTMELALADPP